MRTPTDKERVYKMTYIEYIEKWLSYKESEYSYSTLRTYRMILNKHFRPFFKDCLIENLDRLALQQFVNTRSTSQKTCIAILKKTLKELYYDELTPRDYSSLLRKPPKAHVTRPKDALTREQIDKLFAYLSTHSKWYYLIRLLFTSGVRIGEALALQWSDVLWYTKERTLIQQRDYDQCSYIVLKITKTLDEHNGSLHEPKTATSIRDVIVTDKTTITLLYNQWSAVGFTTEDPIAPSRRNPTKPLTRVSVRNILRDASESIGLPFRLSPHHARLNYTSHSLATGISEKNLQAQLGHSSTNLIRTVYGKAIGNRLEELVENRNIYYFR